MAAPDNNNNNNNNTNSNCKVFIGGLDEYTTKGDVEAFFTTNKAGPFTSAWVARNPPGFAFVEFEDARDALDAVKDLDGKEIRGRKVRVELATVGRKRKTPEEGKRPRRDECFNCGEVGHFSRDCTKSRGDGRGGEYGRNHNGRPSPPRGRSPVRSRSRSRGRSRSRSGSRSRGRAPDRRRSPVRSRSRSRSAGRGAGALADRNRERERDRRSPRRQSPRRSPPHNARRFSRSPPQNRGTDKRDYRR